jgi:hypothetical protein
VGIGQKLSSSPRSDVRTLTQTRKTVKKNVFDGRNKTIFTGTLLAESIHLLLFISRTHICKRELQDCLTTPFVFNITPGKNGGYCTDFIPLWVLLPQILR